MIDTSLDQRFGIGIDLGGTKIEAILLAPDDEVLFRERIPTPRDKGYEAILSAVATMVDHAVDRLSPDNTFTVGVGRERISSIMEAI